MRATCTSAESGWQRRRGHGVCIATLALAALAGCGDGTSPGGPGGSAGPGGPGGPGGPAEGPPVAGIPAAPFEAYGTRVPAKSKALFGQAIWPLTETLRATADLRHTKDEKTYHYGVRSTAISAVPGYDSGMLSVTDAYSAMSYKLGLEYGVAPQSMLYAQVATGYKAGGFSTTAAPLVVTAATSDPLANIPGFEQQVLAKFMVKRLGQPEDIGWATVYLASDESSWITAADFAIDAGATAW